MVGSFFVAEKKVAKYSFITVDFVRKSNDNRLYQFLLSETYIKENCLDMIIIAE
jgi:hypothetical protein